MRQLADTHDHCWAKGIQTDPTPATLTMWAEEVDRLSSALKEAQERHTRLRIAARAVVMAPRLAHRELGNAIDELSEVIENDQPDPTPSPSQEGA